MIRVRAQHAHQRQTRTQVVFAVNGVYPPIRWSADLFCQVVVSASTGLFGVGKNVLDVWCNTTFLREDGEIDIASQTLPAHLAVVMVVWDVIVLRVSHTY